MARPNFFKKVYQDTQEAQRLQNNLQDAINPVLKVPLLDGRAVSVNLVSGANKIEHKLAREIQGYFITKANAAVTIYDTGSDKLYLNIQSSGAASVVLWVF